MLAMRPPAPYRNVVNVYITGQIYRILRFLYTYFITKDYSLISEKKTINFLLFKVKLFADVILILFTCSSKQYVCISFCFS